MARRAFPKHLSFSFPGQTSKVAQADSKDEYKDSYRNRHYPLAQPAVIEATFLKDDGPEEVFRVEVDAEGHCTRYMNDSEVERWPFANQLDDSAPPFVLQHALKNLLLATPTDRFRGFARMLGLNDVDNLQSAIVSLCTKPEASVPELAKRAVADLDALESRLIRFETLKGLLKDFKKGVSAMPAAYSRLEVRADQLLGSKAPSGERLARLIKRHGELAKKVFDGTVAIKPLDEQEQQDIDTSHGIIRTTVDVNFLSNYGKLATRDGTARLEHELSFLSLGREILEEDNEHCPFCGQGINEELRDHIEKRHASIQDKVGSAKSLEQTRVAAASGIEGMRKALIRHRTLIAGCSKALIVATNTTNQESVKSLFGKDNAASWETVRTVAAEVKSLSEEFDKALDVLEHQREVCANALSSRTEEITQAEDLIKAVVNYLEVADRYVSQLKAQEPILLGPARVLHDAIDALAGTEELSILIYMLEKKPTIQRAMRIRGVLDGLKVPKNTLNRRSVRRWKQPLGPILVVPSWTGTRRFVRKVTPMCISQALPWAAQKAVTSRVARYASMRSRMAWTW